MSKTDLANSFDLEIIIVSYNSAFWLKTTLTSLQTHYLRKTKRRVRVTVVDNASLDDTEAILKAEFQWINLIPIHQNVGYAAANNIALRGTTAKYVMLMNSDVESTTDSNLDLLLNYLDKNPACAVVTPRLELSNGQLDQACHRGEPTPWAALTYFSGLAKLAPQSKWLGQYHQTFADLTKIHPIDACSGAAMMVRGKLLSQVGLLDEQFFMYAEDLDWCRRFREAGYTVIFHPGVRLIHHKYKSGIRSTSQVIAKTTRRHFYDTMLQYFDKHYGRQYPRFVRSLLHTFVVIKKGAI